MIKSGRIKFNLLPKNTFLTGYVAQGTASFIPTIPELQNIYNVVFEALKNNLGVGNVIPRYISNEFGSDTGYDGSYLYPFKTLNRAVSWANENNKYVILLSHKEAGNTVYFYSNLDLSRVYIIGGKWDANQRCVRNTKISYRMQDGSFTRFTSISFLANILFEQYFNHMGTFTVSTTNIRKYTNLAHILYCEVLAGCFTSSYCMCFDPVNGDLYIEKTIIRSEEVGI